MTETNGPGRNDPIAQLFGPCVNAVGIERVLKIVRRHLGMDVAFISRFRDQDRVLDHLDHEASAPLHQGQAIPLSEGYCLKVVCGELPSFIPDTARDPIARSLAATHEIPIGSHLSVPIVLENGQVYGTLCCFSYQPNAQLHERDLVVLKAFAEVIAIHFDTAGQRQRDRDHAATGIRTAMAHGAPRIVFQPIYRIVDRRLHGFECLSRFDAEPRRPPDQWFDMAHKAGVGLELESHATDKALACLTVFPVGPCISINSSPEMILSGKLHALRGQGVDLSRVVLEITEHAVVGDYGALVDALAPLRADGMTLAVDDAGAGYSSMRHILRLEPDIIKLDMTLTRTIDSDSKRKALAKGLTAFAHEFDATVVAEGVETAAELDTLAQLGVDFAQGYFLDRPLGLEDALTRCNTHEVA